MKHALARRIFFILIIFFILGGCTTNITEQGYLPKLTSTLPQTQPTQEILVKDGDTIALTAGLATKNINDKPYAFYAYNTMIPGPTFKTTQGNTFTVKFTNNLDTKTTIHWHGLRHTNKDDGVVGVTQEAVQPGDTYMYTVSTPDAGIYWYHPHVREDLQQDLGLAGNIVVTPQQTTTPVFNGERTLLLDDILLNEYTLVPYGKNDATHALMGRFGNILLVNGHTDYTTTVNTGDVVRFYLTNAANARPFNITFNNARMKLVGSDLSLYEHETFINNIIIAPGERYTIDVLFPQEGEYTITHTTPENTFTLGTITAVTPPSPPSEDYASDFNTLHDNEEITEDVNRFKTFFAREPDHTLHMTVDMPMMPLNAPNSNDIAESGSAVHSVGMPCHRMSDGTMMGDCTQEHDGMMEHDVQPIEWEDSMNMMNAELTSHDVTWILQNQNTGKQNMEFAMNARVGDVIKIRLFNDPDSMHAMQHPIHLHGQRFLILQENNTPTKNFVWKDTVLVPAGSTTDILVDVTNPGTWMLHCHIAEHLTAGMMTQLNVQP